MKDNGIGKELEHKGKSCVIIRLVSLGTIEVVEDSADYLLRILKK